MADHILVIEDNRALAENVAEMLEEEGARVTICADAAAGLRVASEQGFDLAIVDIGLGGQVSGLDLVPKLRVANSMGEVLLVTGNATVQSAIQAIRSGVYAYVQKPFDAAQFTTLVHRALAQVALKREKQLLTQRLSASEALYRGVVDTAEACILVLDATGVVRFANRFANTCLLSASGALVGTPFVSLVQASESERAERLLARAIAGGSVHDHECRHAGGKTVRWMFTPLDSPTELALLEVDGDQSPVVLAVGMDMTYRLVLERKNAEAEAMAAMGTLATSLAHEIRNPLNAALLQLELLQRRTARLSDPEAARRLGEPAEIVRQELTRLSTLLNDFLNLARPRQLVSASVQAADLLQSVVTLKQPYAQSTGVTLRVGEIEPSLTMRADADKLRQVLINLVGNAIEALVESDGADKVVEVAARSTSEGVMLTVTDNGPGIPDEVAATMFRPFVTSKAGGTGLGLAIVAKLVAQHGGSVQVQSRPEGGAIASCLIPN